MKKLYTSLPANAKLTPTHDNSYYQSKNQNSMKTLLLPHSTATTTNTTEKAATAQQNKNNRFSSVARLLKRSVLLMVMMLVANMSFAQYPLVAGTAQSNSNGNVTSHVVSLPTGVEVGDLLIAIMGFRNRTFTTTTVSFPTGWTELVTRTAGNGQGVVFYKIATATEAGAANITVAAAPTGGTGGARSAHTVYRIGKGTYQGTPEATYIDATKMVTSATNPNPPSLTPTWGSAKNLWIVGAAGYRAVTTPNTTTFIPTNFSNGTYEFDASNTDVSSASVSTARREFEGTVLDPGTFTLTATVHRAFTIAIRGTTTPAPGETITSTFSYTGSTQTFTAPNCVTSITVAAWGGGGAGGGVDGQTKAGGGGEGGSFVRGTINVSPGDQYNVNVGSGGTGSTGNGTAGGATSFSLGGNTLFNAIGGAGGALGNNFGTGGTATNTGNIVNGTSQSNFYGGNGGTATYASYASSGGGGGSAGAGGAGGNGTVITGGAAGAGTPPGVVGATGRGSQNDGNGNDGGTPGAGGSGARNANNTTAYNGGNGGNGLIRITYTLPLAPTITLGGNPTVCYGATSANLTYTATTGCPDKYSINYDDASLTDVTDADLSGSPIAITLPAGLVAGTHTIGTLTVKNSVYGFVSQTYSISVTMAANTWVGTTTSTDWNVASNWSCGSVPLTNEDVIFSPTAANNLILDQDRTIGNLTNNSDKALVIPTGRTLTIGGTATTNNADRIVIKSNVGEANGALIFSHPDYSANQSVQATVEYDSKTSKPTTNIYSYVWQYMGTPVLGATPVSAFGASVSGSKYGPAGSVLIRKYNEAKNDPGDVGDKWDDVDVNVAMAPFAGYEVVQQNLASAPYAFKGTLRVGDFNTGNLGFTSRAYYRGNYIIANSYAAPIDISKLGDANFNNLEKTIYLYNTGSRDQWLASDYGAGNVTNPVGNPGTYLAVPSAAATTLGATEIPSLNGFMVRSLKSLQTTDTRQFNFTYTSLKSGGGTPANKPMYIKAASASEKQTDTYPLLLIDVKGSNGVDRVHLITAPNTTKGFDNGWDGTKLRTQTDAQIYAFANSTDRYQVSTDSNLNGTILGFFNGTGETAFTLTFRMKDMQNVYNTLELEDLETAAKTSITDGGTFSFNASALSPESRFRINGTIAPPPPVVIEIPITITYDKSKKLTVNNGSTETGTLSVYDMSGNKVYEMVMPVGLTYYKLKLKKGVYVVKASTASYETVEKIIEL